MLPMEETVDFDQWSANQVLRAVRAAHDVFVEAAPRAASFSLALHCRDPRRTITKKQAAARFADLGIYGVAYSSRAIPTAIPDPGMNPVIEEALERLLTVIQEYAWDRGVFDTPVDPTGRSMLSTSFLRGVDLSLPNNVRTRLKTGDEADLWLEASPEERNRLNHISTWEPTNPVYARLSHK